MNECEIEKDTEFVGRYECATHGVCYYDKDKNPQELCPVGEVEEELERCKVEIEELQDSAIDYDSVKERHAVVEYLKMLSNLEQLDINLRFFCEALAQKIFLGEHWPTEKEP